MARRLMTADEVRRMGHDQCVIVVANQRPVFARRWWWSAAARAAPAFALGPAKAAALPPPATPTPPSTASPTSASTPPKPTLRDLKTQLERLDDEDLELEDLPDDFGQDWRR